MKATLIGIGYIALGILTIFIIGQFIGEITTPICAGTMAVMILTASRVAYSSGKKESEGQSDAIKD